MAQQATKMIWMTMRTPMQMSKSGFAKIVGITSPKKQKSGDPSG